MVKFVAEVSSNHNQDLNRCRSFISCAKRIGCDAVKFQSFKIDKLFAPEILERSEQHKARKQWELPDTYLPVLAEHAAKEKIEFWISPFDLETVDLVNPHVSVLKVGSYELTWDALLKKCAETEKPVVISTGMADLDEVKHAVMTLKNHFCRDITLLHCVSLYPTPPHEANLSAMDTLRRETECKVGWSDHTVSAAILHRAVHRFGADIVEFHLDLDGKGDEFAMGHCWLPDQIQAVIQDIRTGIMADGSGIKMPLAEERPERDWRRDPQDGLRPLKAIRDTWKP
ncbi:MAG: N-acetylneuraminate synthase family protein [Acidobacteria bacterium]|nr:N-acetylneuraminate synthase family protein [Acidobacteriota bacterium]MCB9397867.1 N-acetylneuraminate synthase family protein [Acidobacteriota bacterium]